MRPRRAAGMVVGVLALVVSSCQRGDPLARPVSAKTPAELLAWRAQVESDTTIENRRRVEEAFQEIRLKVSGERELKRQLGETLTPGRQEIDETVCARVNGRPLGQVLQLGYELRVRRLKEELAGLEDAMSKNAQLLTRPGDVASRQHLDTLRERQMVRVEKYRQDLAAAERELEPLLKTSGRRLIEVPTDNPGSDTRAPAVTK